MIEAIIFGMGLLCGAALGWWARRQSERLR